MKHRDFPMKNGEFSHEKLWFSHLKKMWFSYEKLWFSYEKWWFRHSINHDLHLLPRNANLLEQVLDPLVTQHHFLPGTFGYVLVHQGQWG